jgi:hypothetical protein
LICVNDVLKDEVSTSIFMSLRLQELNHATSFGWISNLIGDSETSLNCTSFHSSKCCVAVNISKDITNGTNSFYSPKLVVANSTSLAHTLVNAHPD